MELGTFGKHVLLTGAGFSRNWGGYTAHEMMGQILSHLQGNDEARLYWLEVPSFEQGLADARAGCVSQDALDQIERSVLEAFKSLDRQLQDRHGPWFPGMEKLLVQFFWRAPRGIRPDTGYLFTLNQDLLLERRFINAAVSSARDPSLPGVRPGPNARYFSSTTPNEYDSLIATVERNFESIRLKKCFNYIKLHGSFNWKDEDGGIFMVLGNKKAAQVTELPLLDWYHELFKRVLFAGDVRLMIIDYGFQDVHINEVIAR